MGSNRLIYGSATPDGNSALSKWAAHFMPHVDGSRDLPFGPCQAVAVAAESREPLAVVVFHEFSPQHKTIQISMSARSPRWATRGMIAQILKIPFETYGCDLVWLCIPHTNVRALKFNKGIGMKSAPGFLRHMFGIGVHAVHVSMTRKEWVAKWKGKEGHGQAVQLRANAA